MGIAGPRAWHSPPFPAWRGQQGPAQHGGGFALLAVCPPTLFSCSGITNSPSPKSLWTLCFVVWGLRSNPPNPWGWRGCSFPVSWPWRRTGCWLSWPWRRWPRVGFLSPLIPGAGESCSFPVSQPWRRRPRAGCWLPQPQGGGQGLEVAPVSLWHRHVWMSRSQVPSSL